MKAKNINSAELLAFSKGRVELQGRRLLIHDLFALAQFRRDLIESVGMDMARRILTRKGLFWGQSDAAGMQRLFSWDSIKELLLAGPEIAMILGIANVSMKIETFNEVQGTFVANALCKDSAEVEQHVGEMGKSKVPVCWVMVGYLSGYMSYCLGKSVYFIEYECSAAGETACSLIGKDIDSWGTEIDKCLPFFHAADIQKKVRDMSKRIKEQQRILLDQQKAYAASVSPQSHLSKNTRSKAFQNIIDIANRVAAFDTTVLITGETGTGKEVIARHIHTQSARSSGPFIAINCSALPESLLESELFGHVAGAFTGAHTNKLGLFESASKGTIFLDEIGDVVPSLQAKLLRVLQTKEIRPVGSTKSMTVDVRVLSATNKNLDRLVAANKFRQDLLYRLKVVQIALPPLRERIDDILPLARHFLDVFKQRFKMKTLQFAPATLDVLMEYSWPGNVRELENALEHASVLCNNGLITPDFLPSAITQANSDFQVDTSKQSIKKLELSHIKRILEVTKGNRAKAAVVLGISEATLYRRLKANSL